MISDIQSKARDDLSFIRNAMSRAANVSSVSGLGGMLMGGIAFLAGVVAAAQPTQSSMLATWLLAAPVAAFAGAGATFHKARSNPMHWDPIRRFQLCLIPVLIVGALLTWQLWQRQVLDLITPIWMLLYGCGVVAAGTYAITSVIYVGACFLIVGIGALVAPMEWHNALLVATFGLANIVFGWRIYKYHGG